MISNRQVILAEWIPLVEQLKKEGETMEKWRSKGCTGCLVWLYCRCCSWRRSMQYNNLKLLFMREWWSLLSHGFETRQGKKRQPRNTQILPQREWSLWWRWLRCLDSSQTVIIYIHSIKRQCMDQDLEDEATRASSQSQRRSRKNCSFLEKERRQEY